MGDTMSITDPVYSLYDQETHVWTLYKGSEKLSIQCLPPPDEDDSKADGPIPKGEYFIDEMVIEEIERKSHRLGFRLKLMSWMMTQRETIELFQFNPTKEVLQIPFLVLFSTFISRSIFR